MKPTTPMHGSNRPKQAHSHPQRRHRFHEPHQPRPQRRRRFHERPKTTTGGTTTRPDADLLENPNTNARRLAVAPETHDTNARLQPHKTGPFTPAKATPVSRAAPTAPAKAIPVSRAAPTTPAKATPVSQASRHHCHLELRPARSSLSLTGSGRHPREGGTLATK